MRYIGSKVLLLEQIKKIIDKKVPDAKIFCDIFSGTAVVGRYFKQWYTVFSNDILFFSYALQMGTIKNDKTPKFNKLKRIYKIKDPIEYLNNLDTKDMEILEKEKRFFQNTYSPKGNKMYLTEENALRIDFIRSKIEEWLNEKVISKLEYFYLLACIIEGIPYISNISGTYGAFLKKWDKRAYKTYKICRLEITKNNKKNKCFNENSLNLIKKIEGDILYIDPPYNSRQYASNYHILETAALYDYPEVKGKTVQRKDNINKKSTFCIKKEALNSFEYLLRKAKFKYIILSYSNEGLINLEDIEKVMKENGKPETFEKYEIPYRRFKSRSTSKEIKLKEIIFFIEKENLCI
mgnify:CR=1 FL=1